MKTYSVKQIAEILETNPETVRRWIRGKKLKAVQVSRKDGNIVSEDELKRFLSSTPKYLSKLSSTIGALAPIVGIGSAVAGGAVLSSILSIVDEKSNLDSRISPEELRRYIQESIQKLRSIVKQKQALIKQTETEVEEIQKQIERLTALLNHSKTTPDKKREVEKTKED